MSVIDIIILIAFAPAVYFGLKDGFIRQLAGLISLILGIYLAYSFSSMLMPFLSGLFAEVSVTTLKIISFVLILIATILVVSLLATIIEKLVRITMLGWLDKLLGFVFSLFKAALIIGLVIFIIDVADKKLNFLPKEFIDQSVLYPTIARLSNMVFPRIMEYFGH